MGPYTPFLYREVDVGKYSKSVQSLSKPYKVAAGVTAGDISAAGAAGDYIAGILVSPTATTIGVVTLIDGAVSYPLVIGGTYPLTPFYIPLGIVSVSGKWTITTGVAAPCIVFGDLT